MLYLGANLKRKAWKLNNKLQKKYNKKITFLCINSNRLCAWNPDNIKMDFDANNRIVCESVYPRVKPKTNIKNDKTCIKSHYPMTGVFGFFNMNKFTINIADSDPTTDRRTIRNIEDVRRFLGSKGPSYKIFLTKKTAF
jgi:hypothetical protein